MPAAQLQPAACGSTARPQRAGAGRPGPHSQPFQFTALDEMGEERAYGWRSQSQRKGRGRGWSQKERAEATSQGDGALPSPL